MSSPLLASVFDNSPYTEVYRILQRNYIGSWGDACYLYDQIRRDAIWTELTGLAREKPTQDTAQRAQELLRELKSVDSSSVSRAQSIVQTLTHAAPVTAAPVQLKNKRVTNAFATLYETDDDDE